MLLEGKETVFLAAGESDVRELLYEVLRSKGYRIISSTDGTEVLEAFNEKKDEIDIMVSMLLCPEDWEEMCFLRQEN